MLTKVLHILLTIAVFSEKAMCVEVPRICKKAKVKDSSGIQLHWPDTALGNFSTSTPVCVDKNETVLKRKCQENGVWEEFEVQKCTFYSDIKFTSCPYGMKKIRLGERSLCLVITTPSRFAMSCLQYGSSTSVLDLRTPELRDLTEHLKSKMNVTEFWIPMKREKEYNPYQWKILGKKWGDSVHLDCFDFPVQDNYKHNCIKMDILNQKLISENCEENLRDVCIYEGKSVLSLACTKGVTSRYRYHQDNCYYKDEYNNISSKTVFKITNQHSRIFLKDLMSTLNLSENDVCLVDIQTTSNALIDGNFTVINSEGKWILDRNFTCILFEELSRNKTPEMYLKFDARLDKMLLTIYSEEFLWREDQHVGPGVKCFTIAGNELVRTLNTELKLWSKTMKKYDVKPFDPPYVTKSIYELQLGENDHGMYWCEGIAIKSFDLITTKKVLARKSMDGVVLSLKIKLIVGEYRKPIYDAVFLSIMSQKILKTLREKEKLEFYEKLVVENIHEIKAVKVSDFDAKSGSLIAFFHVNIRNKASQNNESSEEYKDFMEKYEKKFDTVKAILSHQLINLLSDIFAKVGNSEIILLSVNSTEYCLPDTLISSDPKEKMLLWEQASIGESLPPTELCLYSSGVPLARKCEGDYIEGGFWQVLRKSDLHCINSDQLSLHTKRLFSFSQLVKINATQTIIDNITSISVHYKELIAADLFYMSKVVQQITGMSNNFKDLGERFNLTTILNNIMNVNQSMIQLSQLKLNTTNILLDSYDNFINSLSTNYSIYNNINNNLVKDSMNETEGTFIIRTEKIIVFICEPGRMNVSGMALVRNPKGSSNETLLDYDIERLYSTQTIDEILNIYQDSIEIASYFPLLLLEKIDKINSSNVDPVKIVIKVFYDDKIFKENRVVSKYKSQSKIISVSLPDHDQNLPDVLPIMVRKSDKGQNKAHETFACGYWEFQPYGSSLDYSEWMQQGCDFLGVSKYDDNLALCACSHLTHFAYLITGTYTHDFETENDVIVKKNSVHYRALNIITLLGSSLSIFGLIGIFITAIFFKIWRQKASSKVLLQLSLAITIQMAVFCFSSTEKYSSSIDTNFEKVTCIISGSSLHYSVLVTFSWMLITAFLQFKRYVIVLGNLKPERFFLKSFFIGWGAPLIPVILLLVMSPYLYIPENYGICYPQGLAFYYGVLLPVGVIVVANLIIFIIVLYNIIYKIGRFKPGDTQRSEHSMILSQLRVSIFLFFLLGLSWIFGFIALTSASIFFSYLFCFTATMQGFVLFIYFIILDPITRRLWQESFRFDKEN